MFQEKKNATRQHKPNYSNMTPLAQNKKLTPKRTTSPVAQTPQRKTQTLYRILKIKEIKQKIHQ